MKLIEMNRGQRMALLVMLLALVAAIAAAVALSGHSNGSKAAADSVEMARFMAEIDSARLDTVKPRRERKAAEKPARKSVAPNKELRQF